MALNSAELDYKTATTLNLISSTYDFLNPGPTLLRPLAPDPSVLDLSADIKTTFHCFYGTPHPSLRPAIFFIAQMSFLAFNPPFRPAGSRGDFRTSFPDSVPFAQPFSS